MVSEPVALGWEWPATTVLRSVPAAAGADVCRPIRVLVADESELVASGVRQMLQPFAHRVRLVDPEEAADLAADLVLHDAFASSPAPFDRLEDWSTPDRVVVYSWTLPRNLVRLALERGVRGCLSKGLTAAELLEALEFLHAGCRIVSRRESADPRWTSGDVLLTRRESEMVALIAQGMTNQQLAEHTLLSVNSVKSYIRSAYRKMGVTSRTNAVLWAIQHGLSSCATPPRSDETHSGRGDSGVELGWQSRVDSEDAPGLLVPAPGPLPGGGLVQD